ncbi:hypothetical protein A3C91_00205 [Candidatus Azambacteria bacterium RIFCSPHIGHO2_02_FULL_52_12]|nr:MAG: hypothetical protein A3C91_00205 [Candidatus Azambacteria bacterium RIFCSPHIGHO2_02_FULL_52_12]
MKNIASEIQGQVTTFALIGAESAQAEGTEASSRKYELLASIEKMKRWAAVYKEKARADQYNKKFLERIANMEDSIVLYAIDIVKMKEEQRAPEEIAVAERGLRESGSFLKTTITGVIADELAALEQKGKDVHAFIVRAVFFAALMASAGALFALLTGLVIAQFFSARITVLRNAAVEIARGNLEKTIIVSSHDEIGNLGGAFNDMARKFEASRTELEKKNKQIEEKLSEVEQLNKLMVGRELKMAELKKEISELRKNNAPQQ